MDKGYVVTVDMGGTRFRVALADLAGRLTYRRSYLTHAKQGREAVFRRISQAAKDAMAHHPRTQILAVGFAAPGPLDPRTGVLFTPPNLPDWRDVPLKTLLQQHLDLPVYVGNDANLAALGEHRYGAGRGMNNIIYLTVSTGVGGGIIADGRLLLGSEGLAGEPGHMSIAPEPRCRCGNYGCLEMLASGTAIARVASERLEAGEPSSIPTYSSRSVTAEAVEKAARAGDALAQSILSRAANYLGTGVVNLVHLFNPEAVIIGGGVSQAAELLFDPVRAAVNERAMPNYRKVQILRAALGDDVGLYGAAALVFDELGLGS